MLFPRFNGFARFAVFMAILFGAWPLAILESYLSGYGFRGLWIRVLQELAMCRGASEFDVQQTYRL